LTEYVCGHSARELQRLETQGRLYAEFTCELLRRAGIAPGHAVLDLGCGVGDVSLIAAELVLPGGTVTGVDRSAEALDVASARVAALGWRHVRFLRAELGALPAELRVDALVGRFVLMHQPDPAAALRAAARHVRPGGIVAFAESHMDGLLAALHSSPHSARYARLVSWLIAGIRAAGGNTDMGLRLRSAFVSAGLPAPETRLEARIEGGENSLIYRYMTESLRSMAPLLRRLGIAALADSDVDVLERELRTEVVASGGVLAAPPVVGAWCRLP